MKKPFMRISAAVLCLLFFAGLFAGCGKGHIQDVLVPTATPGNTAADTEQGGVGGAEQTPEQIQTPGFTPAPDGDAWALLSDADKFWKVEAFLEAKLLENREVSDARVLSNGQPKPSSVGANGEYEWIFDGDSCMLSINDSWLHDSDLGLTVQATGDDITLQLWTDSPYKDESDDAWLFAEWAWWKFSWDGAVLDALTDRNPAAEILAAKALVESASQIPAITPQPMLPSGLWAESGFPVYGEVIMAGYLDTMLEQLALGGDVISVELELQPDSMITEWNYFEAAYDVRYLNEALIRNLGLSCHVIATSDTVLVWLDAQNADAGWETKGYEDGLQWTYDYSGNCIASDWRGTLADGMLAAIDYLKK